MNHALRRRLALQFYADQARDSDGKFATTGKGGDGGRPKKPGFLRGLSRDMATDPSAPGVLQMLGRKLNPDLAAKHKEEKAGADKSKRDLAADESKRGGYEKHYADRRRAEVLALYGDAHEESKHPRDAGGKWTAGCGGGGGKAGSKPPPPAGAARKDAPKQHQRIEAELRPEDVREVAALVRDGLEKNPSGGVSSTIQTWDGATGDLDTTGDTTKKQLTEQIATKIEVLGDTGDVIAGIREHLKAEVEARRGEIFNGMSMESLEPEEIIGAALKIAAAP